MPIIGAFISDSYLGRFRVITMGSIASLLGIIILWLTAAIPNARPESCTLPSLSQIAILFTSFALMSIGAGGIRPCSLAFGANQIDRSENNPKTHSVLQTFFNWYYVSVALPLMTAVTVIVYIQEVKGWVVCFGVPVILMAISSLLFVIGSRNYVKQEVQGSVFTGLFQMVVAAIEKKHQVLPLDNLDLYYHKGSKLATPTQYVSVEQVEDLKSLIKVFPIWSTGITIAITLHQHFPVLQATAMDRHIGPNFEIPAGSFGVFSHLAVTLWIIFLKSGLLALTGSMVVAALVEGARRKGALQVPEVKMSALWLVPQYWLARIAEALSVIGPVGVWVPKDMDINKGHYDYYYWVLALMSLLNFMYFLACTWLYRYRGSC
ncbi:protein NRT1/ PTR FAMILY 1.1-like [Amborella trichopoda]|uniref:protein NRT1/ PTR FAMILY 1.1-like n=1 Tax=Amborella trichopoda TaxID=13333 RepID=UPI0009C0A942|nr:protein NRT1/ PTR FAMILY 1.1-like [Amborella trichopoda]|eukprot:XP_020518243.1 protein NRT1/ PTR FAMILY 1.1-like [Amborella trichopoda]